MTLLVSKKDLVPGLQRCEKYGAVGSTECVTKVHTDYITEVVAEDSILVGLDNLSLV